MREFVQQQYLVLTGTFILKQSDWDRPGSGPAAAENTKDRARAATGFHRGGGGGPEDIGPSKRPSKGPYQRISFLHEFEFLF